MLSRRRRSAPPKHTRYHRRLRHSIDHRIIFLPPLVVCYESYIKYYIIIFHVRENVRHNNI